MAEILTADGVKNSFNESTIKFLAEISEEELTFLDTKVYTGARFDKESILDVQKYYTPE